MKAKDYANKYIPLFAAASTEEQRKEVMTMIFREFTAEIDKLREIRHATSLGALVSIINEQSQKWKVFCNLLPEKELDEIGFRNFWASKIPAIDDKLI